MADLRLSIDVTDVQKAITATKRYERQVDQLVQRYARGEVSSKTYNRGLLQIKRSYEQLGVSSQRATSQVRRYAQQQLQATRTVQQATVAQNQFADSTQRSTRRMGRSQVMVQQTGYQVGDFIVQVQSGTNAFVAFGQQATQVAGTLTLLGGKMVLLGTVLGIAIPLTTAIAAALMRTKQASDEAANGIQALADRVQNARQEIADMTFEVDALRRGFEDLSEFALVSALEEAQDSVRELRERLYELEQIAAPTGPTERRLAAAQETLRIAQEELETYRELRAEQDGLANSAERWSSLVSDIQNVYERFLREARELSDSLKEARDEAAAGLAEKLAEAAEELREAAQEARELKEETAEAKRQAEILAAIDIKSGIDAAGSAAERLAAYMNISLAAAQGLAALGNQGTPTSGEYGVGRGAAGPGGPLVGSAGVAEAALSSGRTFTGIPDGFSGSGSGSSGGGGGQSVFQSRVTGLQSLQSAITAAAEEARLFEQEIQLLDQALEFGLVTQGQYNQMLEEAHSAYNQAIEGTYSYMQALESANETAKSSTEDALMSIVDGSSSAADAFRNMTQEILSEVYRLLVVRPLMESLFGNSSSGGGLLGGILGGLVPNANGNAFNRGSVVPFATGGIVSGPTNFPMTGGRTGLMGEAGPEAIMPLKRGKGGKLGIEGGSGIVVNQTYNFQGGVTREDLGRALPQLVEASKQSIMETVQRGGSQAEVFR